MNKIAESLYAVATALWAGSLWTIGLLVAPALFAVLYLVQCVLAAALVIRQRNVVN